MSINMWTDLIYNTLKDKWNNFTNMIKGVTLVNLITIDSMIIALDIGKKMIRGELQENIIKRYNNIYEWNWITRVIIYFCLICITYIIKNNEFIPICLIFFVTPVIQNKIAKTDLIKGGLISMKTNINMFFRYLGARVFINYCRDLGIRINNNNIFILMNTLNINWLGEFIKNFVFVGFMMIIRSYEMTYYYYKAIKMSYYYNTGYLINKIDKTTCIENLKKIIHKKEWENLCNIENINPLYNLIIDEKMTEIDIFKIIRYEFIKIIILWSWVDWILIRIERNDILIVIIMSILLFNNKKGSFRNFYLESYIILFSIYNENGIHYSIISLFISICIISREFMYNILKYMLFYISNYKSIKIVLNYYQKKNGQKLN